MKRGLTAGLLRVRRRNGLASRFLSESATFSPPAGVSLGGGEETEQPSIWLPGSGLIAATREYWISLPLNLPVLRDRRSDLPLGLVAPVPAYGYHVSTRRPRCVSPNRVRNSA